MLLIFSAAGFVSFSAFLVSRKKTLLYTTIFFLFYVFDLSLIFQYEYFGQNLSFDISNYFMIDAPYAKILISAGALQALWSIVCIYLDCWEGERRQFGPVCVYLIVEVAIVLFAPDGSCKQFVFYSMRQVFLFFMLGYIVFCYINSQDEIYRVRISRFKELVFICAVLGCFIMLEDYGNIITFDPSKNAVDTLLYLSERNFSENILTLLFAGLALKESSIVLRMRLSIPPSSEDYQVQVRIDDKLPLYAKRHGLTGREQEILKMILMGKDNQQVSTELQLAVGTVKVHVHNILKKTHQKSRSTLAKDFWSKS